MANCTNRFFLGVAFGFVIATVANINVLTVVFAVGLHTQCLAEHIIVIQSGNLFRLGAALGSCSTAVDTGKCLDTCSDTGCGSGFNTIIILMAQCIHIGILVRSVAGSTCTAILTGVNGIALFQTGGSNNSFLVRMLQLVNHSVCHISFLSAVLILEVLLTSLAVEVAFRAGFQAGSGLVGSFDHVVAQLATFIDAGLGLIAAGTLSGLVAISGTGCVTVGNIVLIQELMIQSGSLFSLCSGQSDLVSLEYQAAAGALASVILVVTTGGTGTGNCIGLL